MIRFILSLAQQIETPTTAFLKAGLLGAAIVVLAGVVVYMWLDNKSERKERDALIQTLQEQRVHDAQAVTEQLLKINEQCVTALTNAANAMNAQGEAMNQVRTALLERRR